MTYLELKTLFTSIMNRTDLTSALADSFLTLGLLRAQRELQVPDTEILLTTPVDGSYTGISVPTGLNSIITLTATGSSDGLSYLPPSKFLTLTAASGVPIYYTRINGKYQVYPSPTTGCVLNLYYWGTFTAFSGDSSTTPLSISYPDLLIYAALSYACDYFTDDRGEAFEGRYTNIRDTIQDNASTVDGTLQVLPNATFGDPMNE